MILVLNFSHPLTATQCEELSSEPGIEIEVRTVQVQIDNEHSLVEQVTTIADATKLSAEEWQTLPLVVNPPGYAPVAMALLAELHGRMGHFPTLLRLRPVADSTPTTYEVTELLNLQAIRDEARRRR
jgi:hypothetical protein